MIKSLCYLLLVFLSFVAVNSSYGSLVGIAVALCLGLWFSCLLRLTPLNAAYISFGAFAFLGFELFINIIGWFHPKAQGNIVAFFLNVVLLTIPVMLDIAVRKLLTFIPFDREVK